mmetsp:Transcript_16020/g.25050  ORF Transcript_16020/g.25050 Transcript_16020/m.25050 type:complete len:86 (+) Transcript_16020:298-555(+)
MSGVSIIWPRTNIQHVNIPQGESNQELHVYEKQTLPLDMLALVLSTYENTLLQLVTTIGATGRCPSLSIGDTLGLDPWESTILNG